MRANQVRKQLRIPFVTNIETRDKTAQKDQRYINCYLDVDKSPLSDEPRKFLTKRPGVSQYSTTTSGVGRGVWYFNGNVYHVTGNTLYRDNVAIKTLTAGLTGRCGAVKVLAPNETLFLCDGFTAWLIAPDGTVTDVEQSYLRWSANTQLNYWDKIIPTTYANQTVWYKVTTAGTTGATEPTWGATTVTSGTVTFTKVGTYTGAKQYTNRAYAVGDLVQPSTESSIFYKVVKAGTTTAEPTWSLIVGSITTQNGVQFECMGYYGGFPAPHIPSPCFLDGYVFLAAEGTSDIYNSYTTMPWSWNASEFIGADSFSGPIVALARYNNYLAAYGENNMELFYDAANQTGSPLKRHDSFILQTGTHSPDAIVQSEMMMLWLGTSDLGGKTVWLLDGFDPKDIGNVHINRLLTAETNPEQITGYGFRIDGHLFFLLNLPTANKTLLIDIGTTLWYEWSFNGGMFPFKSYTEKDQGILLQYTDGTIYTLSKENYVDTVNDIVYNIYYTIITNKIDFDNRYRKFIYSLDIIGDLNNSNILLQWSDDDYQTWNTGYTISLASRPRLARCGSTRRRAFKLTHTDSTPCRLESLETVFTLGTS